MTLQANPQAIAQTLTLFCDGQHAIEVVEIDKSSGRSVLKTAYFGPDKIGHASEVIAALADSSISTSYFVGLNPTTKNETNTFAASDRTTTFDVAYRRWILIDIDPDRLPQFEGEDVANSRDLEKAYAASAAGTVYHELAQKFGSNCLVKADSGNGYHILLHCSIAHDQATTSTVRRLLSYLNNLLDDERFAKVDVKMFDAPRITALYGTPKRKSVPTETRPHRMSQLVELPPVLEPVNWEAVVALVGYDDVSSSPKTIVEGAAQSVRDLLFEKLLPYGPRIKEQNVEEGASYIIDLRECPLAHEHSNPNDKSGAFVNVWGDGGISVGCHHSHGANADGSGKNLAPEIESLRELPIADSYVQTLDKLDLYKASREEILKLREELEDRSQAIDASNFGEIFRTAGDMLRNPDPLQPFVVKGLFRLGECVNIVAPSKVGKSFLTLTLAIAIATGRKFLDTFETNPSKIAIFDNELHTGTIDDRLRIVCEAAGLKPEDLEDRLLFASFRKLRQRAEYQDARFDVFTVEPLIEKLASEGYSIVIFDALYRFLPVGSDEADNGAMTNLFNRMDGYAQKYGVALLFVHHTSKGDQGAKDSIDVGSGAGAFGRTTDCHITVRKHIDGEPLYVFEAKCRSTRSPKPLTVSFKNLLWKAVEDKEAILDAPKTRRDRDRVEKLVDSERDEEIFKERVVERVEKADDPVKIADFEEERVGLSLGKKRAVSIVNRLIEEEIFQEAKVGRSRAAELGPKHSLSSQSAS